ncbi:MAG TPA: hypothetical protein VIM28_05080 [Solirubrobacterales bacterium]
MKQIDKTAATAQILMQLKPQFGRLVHAKGAEGPVIFDFPSHEYPVQIYPFEGPGGLIRRVCCPISENADWSGNLANFLLRECSELLIGSIVRRGEGIVVEQIIVGDVSGEDLGAIVFTVANLSSHLQRDLTLAGALTTPEAASA